MIKGIGHKKVNVSNEEFAYYSELVKRYSTDTVKGESYFTDLFDTDSGGNITVIHPTNNIPWVILFFVQNLMINQNLRLHDERLENLEKGLK